MKTGLGRVLLLAALAEGMAPKFEKRGKPIEINAGDSSNPHRPKGLKRFVIGDKEVWAINQKNAERKAKKCPPLTAE